MPDAQALGLTHFFANADIVARVILVVLAVMSLLSWYLILSRAFLHAMHWRQGEALLGELPHLESAAAFERYLDGRSSTDPLHALAKSAVQADERYELLRQRSEATASEFLARDIQNAVDEIGTRLDRGLIVLASIASSAPYIGLLGTVWGVYHALVNIGLSGQGTLDQVAGPVGEALIMTAIGLSVAIPAVLGYNGLTRANRVTNARLTSLANHLLRCICVNGTVAADAAARKSAVTGKPAASAV